MRKATMGRLGLMGSVAALGLMGAVSSAQAYQTKFGEFDITFDTTVSVGASVKTQERETRFLPEANGGNVDLRLTTPLPFTTYYASGKGLGGLLPVSQSAAVTTAPLPKSLSPDNYDGSVNSDDGRLNYDAGDVIGVPIKANHDLLVKYRNFTLFARAVGFYDVLLDDEGAGARSAVTNRALGDVGRNYELLDLYLSGEFDVLGQSANLRVGKQVISWGESTFIQNGINIFNPVDVAAFRRPGAEIKEGLVPVNAIFGSISLPEQFSLSGYYALDWEGIEIDPGGTPWAGTDVVAAGTGPRGNFYKGVPVSFTSGSIYGGARRNCGTSNAVTMGLIHSSAAGQAGKLDCGDGGIYSSFINYQTPKTIGKFEEITLGLIDTAGSEGVTQSIQTVLPTLGNFDAKDGDQYGFALRHYADWLGGTELSLYYQRYHSRLPFVNLVTTGADVGISVTADNTTTTNRGIGLQGCGFIAGVTANPANDAVAGGIINGFIANTRALTTGTDIRTRLVNDPQGLLTFAKRAQVSALTGGALTLTDSTGGSSATGNYNTLENLLKVACLANYYGSVNAGGQLISANGSESLSYNSQFALRVEYPEDIDVWGFGFNTTIWGWGVQGEASYRPQAPFQVDSDSLTIAAGVNNCGLLGTAGFLSTAGAGANNLNNLVNKDGAGIQPFCGNNTVTKSFFTNEMFTAQIGTTATFTASEWWVEALGADLGLLVTEFGMVYVPDVEKTWLDNNPTNKTITQYQNIGCQGSDLGLGGLLGLDPKSSRSCRPTSTSAGYVLLGRLDYNNAFNTGYLLSPQFSFSHDYYGTTPAPYSNYLQDRMAASISVRATLNNNFSVNLGYTNFWGGHIENKAADQDYASFSASYSF